MATHSNILAWRILWTEEPGVSKSQMQLSVYVCTHTAARFTCGRPNIWEQLQVLRLWFFGSHQTFPWEGSAANQDPRLKVINFFLKGRQRLCRMGMVWSYWYGSLLRCFGPISSFYRHFHVSLDMLSDLFQLTPLFDGKNETEPRFHLDIHLL